MEPRPRTRDLTPPEALPAAWEGLTAVVVATGPSLTPEAATAVLRARAARPSDLRVLAVNDAYRVIPAADLLYACDAKWWRAHEGAPLFRGERWTQDKRGGLEAAREFGLHCVASQGGSLPSTDPAVITQGMNSGFQAIEIAALMGARRIILVGFDMGLGPSGVRHFFGDHPGELNQSSPYHLFLKAFNEAAPHWRDRGLEIINASARTALTCFPRSGLEEALAS